MSTATLQRPWVTRAWKAARILLYLTLGTALYAASWVWVLQYAE
ncbi:MAG: hypothetical protein AAF290_00610 [Pseudomonadota bacterium]